MVRGRRGRYPNVEKEIAAIEERLSFYLEGKEMLQLRAAMKMLDLLADFEMGGDKLNHLLAGEWKEAERRVEWVKKIRGASSETFYNEL